MLLGKDVPNSPLKRLELNSPQSEVQVEVQILCGRLVYETSEDEKQFLGPLACLRYEEGKLNEIIDPILREQMNTDSLEGFSAIAYQCLEKRQSNRPTMIQIVEKLEQVLRLQQEFENVLALQQVAQSLKGKQEDEDCYKQNKINEIIDPKLKKEFKKGYSTFDEEICPDSVNTFAAIAYKCLQENRDDRPTMPQVVEELEKALRSHVKGVEGLRTSLDAIRSATNDFSDVMEHGGYHTVYRGELSNSKGHHAIVVRRLNPM
ncbi:hypothetical protein L1887_01885 [Cichorium endivia]|nr:hypothetical protein L1887_01885 [Cichorium endivia]